MENDQWNTIKDITRFVMGNFLHFYQYRELCYTEIGSYTVVYRNKSRFSRTTILVDIMDSILIGIYGRHTAEHNERFNTLSIDIMTWG